MKRQKISANVVLTVYIESKNGNYNTDINLRSKNKYAMYNMLQLKELGDDFVELVEQNQCGVHLMEEENDYILHIEPEQVFQDYFTAYIKAGDLMGKILASLKNIVVEKPVLKLVK